MKGKINTKSRSNASERLRRYAQERSEGQESSAKRWEAKHPIARRPKKKAK